MHAPLVPATGPHPATPPAPELSAFERWAVRHWLAITLAIWLVMAVGLLWWRWNRVRYWGLGDTDDNLRLEQVRDWLNGQGWFDLRQRRLGWPEGFDIHWSRLIDLPLAGMIVGLKPIVGHAWAERLAIGIAPLLPLGVTLSMVALTARRLIAPAAFALAAAILLCAQSTMGMFQPTRIDHHGWQLAFLAMLVAGLVDPVRRRGGIVAGLATALSLVIGLEMIPYLALGGVAVAVRWVLEPEEEPRLSGYGYALAPAIGAGFLLFASEANRVPRCDALSPVWLVTMLAAAAAAVALSLVRDRRWFVRLGAAVLVGGFVAAVFAGFFPQCLGQPEGASPELRRLWLDNVREAKSVLRQPRIVTIATLGLPLIGLVGLALTAWVRRRQPRALLVWIGPALVALASLALLFWQVRAGPAAQLLAVFGATALAWPVLSWLRRQDSPLIRVPAIALLFLVVTGTGVTWGAALLPATAKPESAASKAVDRAGARCSALSSMRALDRIPRARMATFVDLGPRLILTTHHDAIAGPYHRNGQAILDVHHLFGGPIAGAPEILRRRGSDYVLICPDLAESTLYRSRNPNGLYAVLARGEPPPWLTPVPLPARSPFKLFRVERDRLP